MIGTFVAIAVLESGLSTCEQIVAHLKSLNLQGRFAKTQSIHLTLQFLGNLAEEQLPQIKEVLQHGGSEVAPFDVEVRQLGAFPHLANPRVVWTGVEPVDGFMKLQSKIQQGLERLGFPRENRDFHPHLTWLNLKSRKNLGGLREYLQAEGRHQQAGVIQVGDIHLYQSILNPQRAEYRQLLTCKLGD